MVEFRQEEDVMILADGTIKWAFERQTEFHLVDWEEKHVEPAPPTTTARLALPGKTASPLLPLREQAAIGKEWTDYRTEVVIPQLMEKHNVDMWIMSMKEHGEDVVWRSFTQPIETYARRRTVYVFTLKDGAQVAKDVFVGLDYQGQWPLVKEFVETANPSRIAVNIDEGLAFSDGLASGERMRLEEQLGEDIVSRFVREPELAVDFISIRAPGMNEVYREMNQRVHQIIRFCPCHSPNPKPNSLICPFVFMMDPFFLFMVGPLFFIYYDWRPVLLLLGKSFRLMSLLLGKPPRMMSAGPLQIASKRWGA